ncbi:hypothetical protein D3C72_1253320 [compost metagenome]
MQVCSTVVASTSAPCSVAICEYGIPSSVCSAWKRGAFGKLMLAIGMVPRISALRPVPSGACATNGECHAVLVCTGTMMVTPSMVTAL